MDEICENMVKRTTEFKAESNDNRKDKPINI